MSVMQVDSVRRALSGALVNLPFVEADINAANDWLAKWPRYAQVLLSAAEFSVVK